MTSSFQTHSPIDNRLLFTRNYATEADIDTVLESEGKSATLERPIIVRANRAFTEICKCGCERK